MAWYGPDCEQMMPTGTDGFVIDDFRQSDVWRTLSSLMPVQEVLLNCCA
jgi:hypothetical protein